MKQFKEVKETKEIKRKKIKIKMNIDRVKEFAEVYTSEKDVNNMLDTVSEETLRIDSRFLEPACGNGNFLVQILIRKINVIIKRYQK